MYAKPSVRKSLLAKMLEELLDTRVMVKQAMKRAKGDKVPNMHSLNICRILIHVTLDSNEDSRCKTAES